MSSLTAPTAAALLPLVTYTAGLRHLLKNLRDVVPRVFKQNTEILELKLPPMNHFQRLTNLRLDRAASKERTR